MKRPPGSGDVRQGGARRCSPLGTRAAVGGAYLKGQGQAPARARARLRAAWGESPAAPGLCRRGERCGGSPWPGGALCVESTGAASAPAPEPTGVGARRPLPFASPPPPARARPAGAHPSRASAAWVAPRPSFAGRSGSQLLPGLAPDVPGCGRGSGAGGAAVGSPRCLAWGCPAPRAVCAAPPPGEMRVSRCKAKLPRLRPSCLARAPKPPACTVPSLVRCTPSSPPDAWSRRPRTQLGGCPGRVAQGDQRTCPSRTGWRGEQEDGCQCPCHFTWVTWQLAKTHVELAASCKDEPALQIAPAQ
ncbi:uncharacterized protein LOC142025589 [Carettochelys insculpta]|uniref:uncharacterized protein LOC142025589 n=1 Tax=Carettochelys insculpta TaxID=44489 RepID=UPI003EBC5576